jgi:hypothetical protein
MTSIVSAYDIPLTALSGARLDPGLLRGRAALIVNVASFQHAFAQLAG